MSERLCLIVNPAAGGGKAGRVLPAVSAALEDRGFGVRTELTRNLDHARELAREAAMAGETVVCLSGDGMVGAVSEALRDTPGALLGVLPGGRGNDLARVLGIPADPVRACDVIAAGFSRSMDLGEVVSAAASTAEGSERQALVGGPGGAKTFVGIASVGFDSEANRIANEAPAWLGGLVYAYGALRALISWRPARFTIELDPPGERHSFEVYSVGAANSKTYGGGMKAAPDALLDDGLLEVPVLESVSKLAFVTKILPKVFKGNHVEDPGVRVFRAREVLIEADRPFTMYADGDPIGELPVVVRAVPGAVRVLVPAEGPGGDAF
ncbi:MAG: diacylglycerol kinase family protein, partial [Solirubrobacteraceae bacterium]